MAFMGVLGVGLFMLGILVAVIFSMFLIGFCLLVIGVTGTKMNKIYKKQTKSNCGVSNRLYNVASIILGIGIMLFVSYAIIHPLANAVVS